MHEVRSGMWQPEIKNREFISIEFSDGQFLEKGNHRPHTVDEIEVTNLIASIDQIEYKVNFQLEYAVHVGLIGMGVAVTFHPPIEGNLIQIGGIVVCRLTYPTDQSLAKGVACTIGSLKLKITALKS